LLPVPTVAGKAGNFPGGHGPDSAERYFGHHPFKARSHDTAGSRTTQVLIDYFNLRPAQLPEALFHGVLQSTTFLMVRDLVQRGLADIQYGFALLVARSNFLIHRVLLRANWSAEIAPVGWPTARPSAG
jgi:hypothetical protein